MKKIFFLQLIIFTALFFTSCADNPPVQYESTEQTGIIYKTAGSEDVELDIFYPTNRIYEKNPTVILLHGGGWITGSKNDFYRDFAPLCAKLREKGITVVGVEYRLALDGLTWRDCLDDCKDALKFLLEHAEEYDIAPENIGIVGYSAGAHLAIMTSMDTKNVKYCVSLSAPTTFSMQRDSVYYSAALEYYINIAFGGDIEREIIDASPIVGINGECGADFLIINGVEDYVIPVSHAELFSSKAEACGIETELMILDKLTHWYPDYSDFRQLCETVAEKIAVKLS